MTEVKAPQPEQAQQTPKNHFLASLGTEECTKIQTICLLILTCLICGGAAYLLKSVLLPFVFAIFLTLSLNPIVEYLNYKLHVPKVLSIIMTLLLGGAILVSLTIVVSNSVVELTNNVDLYERRFINLVDSFCENPWLQRLNFKRTDILNTIGTEAANSIGNAVAAIFNALFSLVSNIVIIGIYLIFLLFGTSMGDKNSSDESTVIGDIYKSIKYYVLVKVVISITVGVLTWMILSILNVPMAYVLGLLAFALNFIPNVGPIVAVVLPIPMVILSPEFTLTTLSLVIILPTIVHLISGHLVEPNVIGESLDLDPIVILLTLMLAGVIWGPVGMLLSTPMTVAGKIIIDRIDWAKPIASLLAAKTKPKPAPSDPNKIPLSKLTTVIEAPEEKSK